VAAYPALGTRLRRFGVAGLDLTWNHLDREIGGRYLSNMKPSDPLITFVDPAGLTDRDLQLLTLYRLTLLQVELRAVMTALADAGMVSWDHFKRAFPDCEVKVFNNLEKTIRKFETRKQKPSAN
jgi:hypothetical protein